MQIMYGAPTPKCAGRTVNNIEDSPARVSRRGCHPYNSSRLPGNRAVDCVGLRPRSPRRNGRLGCNRKVRSGRGSRCRSRCRSRWGRPRRSSELEILNCAVESNSRRCGIGAALLAAALQWAQTFQATQAILEVRAANLAALRFYARHKFEVVGRRPRYYTAPVEDALLLTATLN